MIILGKGKLMFTTIVDEELLNTHGLSCYLFCLGPKSVESVVKSMGQVIGYPNNWMVNTRYIKHTHIEFGSPPSL